MIRNRQGQEVRIVGVGEPHWRTGQQVLIVENSFGERRQVLRSRLLASGGKDEIDAAIQRLR